MHRNQSRAGTLINIKSCCVSSEIHTSDCFKDIWLHTTKDFQRFVDWSWNMRCSAPVYEGIWRRMWFHSSHPGDFGFIVVQWEEEEMHHPYSHCLLQILHPSIHQVLGLTQGLLPIGWARKNLQRKAPRKHPYQMTKTPQHKGATAPSKCPSSSSPSPLLIIFTYFI